MYRSAILLFSCIAYSQTPQADLFVSPMGNDSWSGKLAAPNSAKTDGPLASVARAQAVLRDLRKSNPNQARTVLLRGGAYYLPLSPTAPGTLRFSAYDSGSTNYPITWQNYPGETPVISGGIPAGKAWRHVSGSLWQVTLPADIEPFETLYYNGQRRLRSRLQSSAGVGYYMQGGACYSTVTRKKVDPSLCNLGTFLRIAAEIPAKDAHGRCPAVASVQHPSAAKCLDRFVYDPADPIAPWVNLHPNDTACPAASGASAKYPAGDIELTLFNSSTADIMRVSCVDTSNHIIYLSAPMKGDSVLYDSFGPVKGHRYIVENTRDAFDAERAAGQTRVWFLDRSSTPWILNYLAAPGENPNNDLVIIPQVKPVSPIGGSLLSAIYLDWVTFRGITFEIDNFVPPPSGFNKDENSEDTLPEAIDCISCEEVTFDGITVRHTSASGIEVASGSGDIDRPPVHNRVINSAFYDIGSTGIRIGYHPRVSDRSNHVVQFVTVENNIVQGYSRVFPAGEGIAQSNGHDVTYLHNDITDGYHAGLSVCVNGCYAHNANGFNITAEYNHIWNIMQGITSGGGALYFSVGSGDGSGTGNKILNNVVHDVADSSVIDNHIPGYGYGGYGIFLDNKSADIDVAGNVVYGVTDKPVAAPAEPPKGVPSNRIRDNSNTKSATVNAGRNHPVIVPPAVPPAFPTFSLRDP